MAKRLVPALLILALSAPALALPLALDDAEDAPTVTIKRDAFGVPHVYADDAYSLFWGNGYAMAQDRLFQMDVLRHVGKGESAQYLGPGQLEMDLATRRELYTDEERTSSWNALPAAHRTMFQGFVDGVNAWIAETRADPTLLSAEFYAIGHPPEDWEAEDTIAIAQFLLDIFGAGSGGNELDNARMYVHLVETLGEAEAREAFDDFFWMHDASTYLTIPADEYQYASTEGRIPWDEVPEAQWDLIEAAAGATPFAGGKSLVEAAQDVGLPVKFGSNALVVSPQYAESGNALLLGGPQMAYHNPMIPYEVALHGAGFDALGMGVGGAPGVIIGRTQDYAWTVTSGSSDQVDVVAFRIADWDARTYHESGDDGPVLAMDCRTEVHLGPPTAIDQNPPELAVQEVCRTVRGPVFAVNAEDGYVFVRERTHRLDELRSGILWLTLGQNADLASFQAHMETFCFEFNFHVAADTGDIAYFHWGCNPVRADGYDPRFPRLAGEWDWVDVRSGSELPHIVNPEKGYLVNWNNKPADGWSSGDAMEKWGPVHRAELFEETVQKFLAVDGKLSYEDLEAINVEISTRSPFPPNLVPALLEGTENWPVGTAGAARAALAEWLDEGATWEAPDATCAFARAPDACFGTYHPGFAVYERWRGIMQEVVFRDELGPHVREMGFVPELSSDPHAADHGREDNKDNVLWNAIEGRAQHDWCDDVATAAEETCADAFEESLWFTLDELAREYGTGDVSQWRQDAHTIKFVALSGGPAHRIPMVNRPSFNHLYDWGTGQAASVLPPGTDQYWFGPDFLRFSADGTYPDAHKTDQLALYAAFAYKPAQMSYASWESEETHATGAPPLSLPRA